MIGPDYTLLDSQLRALLGDEPDALAAASNFVAYLYCATFCRLQSNRECFI